MGMGNETHNAAKVPATAEQPAHALLDDAGDCLVTVIVPACNAGATLAQCMDSILAQTHERIEVLLLDDGSTDGSGPLMDRYAERDERVRVIHKPNEGYGATCNRGIDEAHGHWIAIVEPDDWILPGMYATMLGCVREVEAASGTMVDLVKTPYWRITDPDTPSQEQLPCRYQGRIRAKQPMQAHDAPILLRYHPSIWSALYRTSFLRNRGIRFHEIPGAGWADNPFLIDTLCQARAIAYLDEAFYCYREETPEKMRALAQRDPAMPMRRWCDMADSLERIGVTDDGIWDAQYARAFSYLRRVLNEVPLDAPGVREATVAMFERMDPARVYAIAEVSPEHKALFAQLRGLPAPRGGKVAYSLSLAKKAAERLREEGIAKTLGTIGDTLHRK